MNLQIVMAHCDDEVIFGWPVLRYASSILICSNDRNNPDRAWCRYRYKALQDIGELLGIPVHSLDYPSDFYKLNNRDGSLRRFMDDVIAHVNPHAEYIYTHNWMGEYGHLDHILIYYVMLKSGKKLYTSDMHLESDWIGFPDIPQRGRPVHAVLAEAILDMDFYNQCKAIYDRHGVWTWNQEPITNCKVLNL